MRDLCAIGWKGRPRNDPLCVDRDDIHSLIITMCYCSSWCGERTADGAFEVDVGDISEAEVGGRIVGEAATGEASYPAVRRAAELRRTSHPRNADAT